MLEIAKKVIDHNHDKYISISEFNKLTAENFAARLSQANLITKTDLDTKLRSLNKNINLNKTKHLALENKLEKTFDSSDFRGKIHFVDNDGT